MSEQIEIAIEHCAQIAEKIGREYPYDEERAGAFGAFVAYIIRQMKVKDWDEIIRMTVQQMLTLEELRDDDTDGKQPSLH